MCWEWGGGLTARDILIAFESINPILLSIYFTIKSSLQFSQESDYYITHFQIPYPPPL